ncbi:hypothetical protein FRB98_007394 [Tulasnella sp. 332]|nr:hypothetical protein FRB98_007394 [Tulasnella sp. 332]
MPIGLASLPPVIAAPLRDNTRSTYGYGGSYYGDYSGKDSTNSLARREAGGIFSKLLPTFIGETLNGIIGQSFQNQMAATAVALTVSGTLVAFDKFVAWLDKKSQDDAKPKDGASESTSYTGDTFSRLSASSPTAYGRSAYSNTPERPAPPARQGQQPYAKTHDDYDDYGDSELYGQSLVDEEITTEAMRAVEKNPALLKAASKLQTQQYYSTINKKNLQAEQRSHKPAEGAMTEATTEKTMSVLNAMAQMWNPLQREKAVLALKQLPELSKTEKGKLERAILDASAA